MRKINYLVLLFLFIFWSIKSGAQHCQYDHTELVGVRPVFGVDSQIINGLRITLVDVRGNPIIYNKDIYQGDDHYLRSEKDTMEFWRNPPPNEDIIHKNRNTMSRHFTQAGTDYIFLSGPIHHNDHSKFIKIEDIDGAANGGDFETMAVSLDKAHAELLCGYPDGPFDFKGNYNPYIRALNLKSAFKKNSNSVSQGRFRYELQINPTSYPQPNCKGCYYSLIGVFDLRLNKYIFSKILLNVDNDATVRCNDSLNLVDYNFDGQPDFKLCSEYNTGFDYYLYDSAQNTFLKEPILSRLKSLEFDFNNMKVRGEEDVYTSGVSYHKTYLLSGKKLSKVSITTTINKANKKLMEPGETQDFRYEKGDLILLSDSATQKRPGVILVHKTDGRFNYDLEVGVYTFAANNPTSKPIYNREVNITEIESHQLVFNLKYIISTDRSICSDSLEIGDYNFDGFTDYRYCYGNSENYTYLIYNNSKNKFILDPLLSKLEQQKVFFTDSIFTGVVSHYIQTEPVDRLPNPKKPNIKVQKQSILSSMEKYVFKGKGLKDVEVQIIDFNDQGQIKSSKRVTFTYIDNYLNMVSSQNEKVDKPNSKKGQPPVNDNYNTSNIKQKVVGPFRYVLELNPPGYNIPAEKGSYAKRYFIYRLRNNEKLFTTHQIGNTLKEDPSCKDSIYAMDYNFDGYPDFAMCSSARGSKMYYIYHTSRKTFVPEPLLNQLLNLKFDFEKKVITANTNIYKIEGYPNQNPHEFGIDYYTFSGKDISEVTIETKYPNDTNTIIKSYRYINQKLIPKAERKAIKEATSNLQFTISRAEGPFVFELVFNPEGVQFAKEEGNYAKVLKIFNASDNRKLLENQIIGNTLRETTHYKDSLEIADFNFDGYPDIRIYNSLHGNKHIYYLYNTEDDIFFREGLMSELTDVRFSEKDKFLTGWIINSSMVNQYTLSHDTLTAKTMYPSDPKSTQTTTFLYKNGLKKYIPNPPPPPPKINIRKEFGDYNFDSLEDFRMTNINDTTRFNYYLFNQKIQGFEFDSLLSNMKYTQFSWNPNVFNGQITIIEDLTVTHYNYELLNGKITLTGMTVITHVHKHSEEVIISIYKLENGVMKLIDSGKVN